MNAFRIVLTEGPKLLIKQKYGSSEIWGDKLKVLNNRQTESRRGTEVTQWHGGADGTKRDGGVAYRFLITILS